MNTSNITNYKPKDFAELLGVSVKTLQRWCTTTIYGRPKRQIILGDSLQKTWVLALTL